MVKEGRAWFDNNGNVYPTKESAEAEEMRVIFDERISEDPLYYHGDLHIDTLQDLKDFLSRHKEFVLKIMNWKE